MSGQPPLIGQMIADVLAVQATSIHGDIYYDLVARLRAPDADEGDTQDARVRVASHLCEREPTPGDQLTLSFLMGQINGVTFG